MVSAPKIAWCAFANDVTATLVFWRARSGYRVCLPGGAMAASLVFTPDDMLLIVRRNAGSATATNALFHIPPGKNMNP